MELTDSALLKWAESAGQLTGAVQEGPGNGLDADTLDGKHLDAIEIPINLNETNIARLRGGGSVFNEVLKEWVEAGAYEATSATFDSDGVLSSATVKWPDGSAGTLTVLNTNTTWLAVDGYQVTHDDSGKTVSQSVITRDSDGAVTTKPALTVA